jgi:ABC-type multidrug transport system fused ATPase/permease subunit
MISLFALTMAAPEAAPDHFLIRPFLAYWPALAQLAREPRNLVILTSLLMIVFVAIKSTIFVYSNHRSSLLSQRISLEVSRQALQNALNQDYQDLLGSEPDALVHSILNRSNLGTFLLHNFFFQANCFSCLALFSTLAILEPKLTLITAISFGLASLFVYGLVRQKLDLYGRKVQEYIVQEGHNLVAISQGFREIIIYARQKTALKHFLALGQKAINSKAFLNFAFTLPSQSLEVVGFGTIGLIVILMILANLPLAEIIATTSMLMLTAWRILPAVSRCLSYTVSVRSLRAQALAILELAIDQDKAQKVRPKPDPDFAFNRELTLENVAFAYPKAQDQAVKNLSLTIPKGQSLGLIGQSGSGKTTLALILSGLIQPQDGRFLVDGQELSPAKKEAYYQILGYVPQNPLLVEGTLAENVAFSQWGEESDRARVMEVCQEAAMTFAFDHPLGLDQPVTPGSLSGGQAQRAAIARALYPRPKIVIFDEATSALDLASENIIKNTLERFQGQLTSVIIAHRLSTVETCDALVWLEAGSIKMVGPPKEIIPLYQKNMDELSLAHARQNEGLSPSGPIIDKPKAEVIR